MLIYNHQIKEFGLQNKFPYIQEGDKIKFIKLVEANPFKFDVISYITSLPTEFKLKPYVDYETQFEKTFLDPMRFILQKGIGWEHEPKASLEAFFWMKLFKNKIDDFFKWVKGTELVELTDIDVSEDPVRRN